MKGRKIISKKTKVCIILSVLLLLSTFFSAAKPSGIGIINKNKTDSITQHGITWSFLETVEFGQYVNGDYWVVGPVTVVQVDPAPTTDGAGNSLNGSMINPRIGVQSYDSRTYMWKATAGVTYPIRLHPGDSLVSAISDTSLTRNSNMPLLTAAVLTVVDNAPSETAFRPTYIGTQKPLYDFASVDTSLLPSLPLAEIFPSQSDITAWERKFERPWLIHGSDWRYGRIVPSLNGHWYHQNQAIDLSGAAVLLVSDWSGKETLLIRYLQSALDYYSVHLQGGGGPYYYRWPIVFAGILMGEPEMRDMFVDATYTYLPYHDSSVYFRDDPRLNRTQWSNIVPASDTWTYYEARTGKPAVFYTVPDIGGGNAAHHEHLHPDEWGWIEEAGYAGGGSKQETYRRMHSVGLVGFSLAALAMNAEPYLANDAFIPYTDRWMSEDADLLAAYGHSVSSAHPVSTSKMSFVDSMWEKHRASFE